MLLPQAITESVKFFYEGWITFFKMANSGLGGLKLEKNAKIFLVLQLHKNIQQQTF